MADELRIGLSELLRKARMEYDADFLRESVRVLSQALMEMEVEEHVGAARHERSPGRVAQRNGYRQRNWDTRVGTPNSTQAPSSGTRPSNTNKNTSGWHPKQAPALAASGAGLDWAAPDISVR